MRMLSRAAAAIAAGVVLLPTPAHPSGWSSPDAEADVSGWHWDPQPEPCGTMTTLDRSSELNADVVRLGVRHTRGELRLAVRFRDLDEALEQDVSFYVRTARADWDLDLERFRTASGEVLVLSFLARTPAAPTPDQTDECGSSGTLSRGVRCAITHSFDFEADTITAAVPRSCLRHPRWIRVGVSALGWDDVTDPATTGFGGFSDEWGTHPEGDSSFTPPVGPRITAPAGSQIGSPSHRSRTASSSTGSRRSLVTARTGLPSGTTAASAN